MSNRSFFRRKQNLNKSIEVSQNDYSHVYPNDDNNKMSRSKSVILDNDLKKTNNKKNNDNYDYLNKSQIIGEREIKVRTPAN